MTMMILMLMVLIWNLILTIMLMKQSKRMESEKDNLLTALTNLAEAVADLKEPIEDPVEKKLREAHQTVLNEYIDNIVAYNPYGTE
mgnify:CR=1 FL=1